MISQGSVIVVFIIILSPCLQLSPWVVRRRISDAVRDSRQVLKQCRWDLSTAVEMTVKLCHPESLYEGSPVNVVILNLIHDPISHIRFRVKLGMTNNHYARFSTIVQNNKYFEIYQLFNQKICFLCPNI